MSGYSRSPVRPCALSRACQAILYMGLVTAANGMPSYRFKLPNGDRVPCPDGVAGCRPREEADQPESICKGLGHATCAGGDFPLNPFGADFAAASFTWGEELCRKDSDGDGLTNGEELGDPCCTWREQLMGEEVQSSYRLRSVSHPGFANATTVPHMSSSDCTEDQVAAPEPAHRFFLPGEDQHVATYRISNYTVQHERVTTYADFFFIFDVPACRDAQCYIAGIQPVVDNHRLVHHYLLSACDREVAPEDNGKIVYSPGQFVRFPCPFGLGEYTPGSGPVWESHPEASLLLPPWVKSLQVQVHYDNPDLLEGQTDSSGFDVYLSTMPRKFMAEHLYIAQLSIDFSLSIPPQHPRFFIARKCKLSGLTEPIHAYESWAHAHLLGTEMYTALSRGGNRTAVWSEPTWYFDDQYRKKLPPTTMLQNGDVLESMCVYNSMPRTRRTMISIETEDEMCWSMHAYYPAQPNLECKEIETWTGDLGTEKRLEDIFRLHPGPASGGHISDEPEEAPTPAAAEEEEKKEDEDEEENEEEYATIAQEVLGSMGHTLSIIRPLQLLATALLLSVTF